MLEQLYANARVRELYESARSANPLPRDDREDEANQPAPVRPTSYSFRDAAYQRLAWLGFAPGA